MPKPKRRSLSAALSSAPETSAAISNQSDQPNASLPQKKNKGRESMKMVSGWFPKYVGFELDDLRLERTRALGRKVTLQELQAEAINDLFKKYGRPELAPVTEA